VRVVTALAGEPMVIGYDVINEPGGDERTQIGPLHEDAARAIRAIDGTAILFVSPANITSAGNATSLQKPSFSNFVYAPHYYDPTLILFHGWQGSDEKVAFDEMSSTSSAWGVPLFLGEYGAAPSTEEVDGYMAALATQMDRVMASGAQWVYTPGWDETAKDGWNREDFSIVDGAGATRANFRSRPFVRRVAGTPAAITLEDKTDPKKNALTLTWDHDPAHGETELFAPASWFGGDLDVSSNGASCTTDGDFVRCHDAAAGMKTVKLSVASPRCGLTGAEAFLVLALARTINRWKRRRLT
jgi:endoglycosylceramidase